jgi:hypothetical protein
MAIAVAMASSQSALVRLVAAAPLLNLAVFLLRDGSGWRTGFSHGRAFGLAYVLFQPAPAPTPPQPN